MEQVSFEPDEPELALMMRTGEVPYHHVQRFRRVWYYERGFAPVYSPICDGPCATQLVPGAYHLALSKDGGRAVPAGVVMLGGPSTIHASYDDHSGERLLGGIILVGGIIGGVVMIVASVDRPMSSGTDGPLLAGGLGVAVGSAILGTIFASRRDGAHVTVTPLSWPAFGALKEPLVATRGAVLTVRF